jgi:NAD+ synthase
VDASEVFDKYLSAFADIGIELDTATQSNLKARIRMSILYAYAQKHNYLVLGTDNKDERYTGYFTKHGDGACDILPIAHLLKGEVVEASKLLGISSHLAERVPTASLFEGQTDEKEMGVTYKDLDAYILGGKVDEEVELRIQHLHRISDHKRVPTPMPKEFDRGE